LLTIMIIANSQAFAGQYKVFSDDCIIDYNSDTRQINIQSISGQPVAISQKSKYSISQMMASDLTMGLSSEGLTINDKFWTRQLLESTGQEQQKFIESNTSKYNLEELGSVLVKQKDDASRIMVLLGNITEKSNNFL